MGILKDTRKQLRELRQENARLNWENTKLSGYLAYIAMMGDIELPEEEEEPEDV